jgi:hypothetical protein
MGIFFESKEEKATREYHDGKDAGRKSDWVDKIAHNTVGSGSKHYDKGFSQGVKHQERDRDNRRRK